MGSFIEGRCRVCYGGVRRVRFFLSSMVKRVLFVVGCFLALVGRFLEFLEFVIGVFFNVFC